MAKDKNTESPEITPAAAAVAAGRLEGELAALERESGYPSSKSRAGDLEASVKACKAELAKLRKIAAKKTK